MKDSFRTVLLFLVFLWLVEIINLITGRVLVTYGILPRQVAGLPGIIFHPFIHANLQHIMSNTIPVAVLGFIIGLEGRIRFIKVTLFIVLLGGVLLWLLGRSSYHIGASLLIFGYLGYIISNAFVKKSVLGVLAAFITTVFYGSLIYGLIPADNHISWEGHLLGLFSGIMAGKMLKH